MIKNVIFDLDGTLLDTREGILESVKYAAKELGYKELSHEELLEFVGPPIQMSFMNHYGCDEKTAQKAANIFRDYYKNKALLKATPYNGIYELCQRLKDNDIKMAVATYKREDYALRLLEHFDFHKYCDPMHGADNNNKLKKKDIVQLCLDEMGASKEAAVLVGDTDHDANGALEAGIPFIGVTYGFGFKAASDLNGFSYYGVASEPLEIAGILLKV